MYLKVVYNKIHHQGKTFCKKRWESNKISLFSGWREKIRVFRPNIYRFNSGNELVTCVNLCILTYKLAVNETILGGHSYFLGGIFLSKIVLGGIVLGGNLLF